MPNIKKTNDTTIRALNVLKLLSSGDYSLSEIVDHIFKSKISNNELRTDTLYKYFNTFKLLGIDVARNRDKYTLKNSPLKIALSSQNLYSAKLLWAFAQILYDKEELLQIKKLLKNTVKHFSNITFDDLEISQEELQKCQKILQTNTNKEEIHKFLKLCEEKYRVEFEYFNRYLNERQTFIVEPQEIALTTAGCVLKCYNPEIAEIQNFYTEDITNLKQLPTLSRQSNVKSSVTFKIKGRLAQAYDLKINEHITETSKDYKIITNSGEDKNELLKRLLRYGNACEVLYPKTYRQQLKNMLKKIKLKYQ